MSGPTTPRSPANPTRQQLDDLDALLQRMLELPVNQLEDGGEAPPPKKTPPVPPPAPVVEPVKPVATVPPAPVPLPVLEPTPVLEAPDVRQWRLDVPQAHPGTLPFSTLEALSPPPPAAVAEKTLEVAAPLVTSPSIPLARPVEVEVPYPGLPLSAPAPRPISRPAPVSPPEPEAVDPALPWGMRWLIQLNVWFDEVADRLGSPGRWMRSRAGRTVLGWTGVTLLGIAGFLLVLDWFGWTR